MLGGTPETDGVAGLPLVNGQLNVYIDRTGRVLDVSAPADFAVHLPDI